MRVCGILILSFFSTLVSASEGISVKAVLSLSDIPSSVPADGHFRVHLIDVGTGLSILVQGHDWNLLYDAGSADDSAGNRASGKTNSRQIAYLYKALGASGPKACVPNGDAWPYEDKPEIEITHMVLSHPHNDHGSMMDDVFHCYSISNMWESGAINHKDFYDRIVGLIAAEDGLVYHTANAPSDLKQVTVVETHDMSARDWVQFHEGDTYQLGTNASFMILNANGVNRGDLNDNSVVIRLDLGGKSMLLTGDIGSGGRADPSAPLGAIEKQLVDNFSQQIDVDILQVAHHGSETSTRIAFLDKVTPSIALISGGPKKYASGTLPDQSVVDAIKSKGIRVLRTDEHDAAGCSVADRIGRDQQRPGGCDNFILEW